MTRIFATASAAALVAALAVPLGGHVARSTSATSAAPAPATAPTSPGSQAGSRPQAARAESSGQPTKKRASVISGAGTAPSKVGSTGPVPV